MLNSMDELYMNNGQWEKQDTKEYILWIHFYKVPRKKKKEQFLEGSIVVTFGIQLLRIGTEEVLDIFCVFIWRWSAQFSQDMCFFLYAHYTLKMFKKWY